MYQIAEKEGLTIIQAHPFRSVCFRRIRNAFTASRFLTAIHAMIPTMIWPGRAEQAGLPGTAGSDFHQVQDLASCCVGFEKLPGDGQELAEVIRQGRFTREIFRGI